MKLWDAMVLVVRYFKVESLEKVMEAQVNMKRIGNVLIVLNTQVNDKRKNIKKDKLMKRSNIKSIHFERYETFRRSSNA